MGTLIFQIISSDITISSRWQTAFRKEGWTVAAVSCCPPEEGNCANSARLDLIEIGIPGCKNAEELRSVLQANKPLFALVFGDPQKVSNSQIAALLEAGADDFVYKNLDERVLVAKMKAGMRRLLPAITEAAAKLASSSGDIKIDRSRRTVKIKAGRGKYTELSNLTEKEFDILSMLVDQEKRVVSRESMLEKLWGDCAGDVYSDCINKHVESLRKKLGLYGRKVKTVYGSGYMFTGGGKA